jgi:hypothetical protein
MNYKLYYKCRNYISMKYVDFNISNNHNIFTLHNIFIDSVLFSLRDRNKTIGKTCE